MAVSNLKELKNNGINNGCKSTVEQPAITSISPTALG